MRHENAQSEPRARARREGEHPLLRSMVVDDTALDMTTDAHWAAPAQTWGTVTTSQLPGAIMYSASNLK